MCRLQNIAMHDYQESVTTWQTHGQTDGQTDAGQSDPFVLLCFTGDTKNSQGTHMPNIDVCKTLMPPFPNIWRIGLTFDLDLWPTDLKINRDHLLIKDYLPTKFEASGSKPSWVISCTRLRETDIPTDWQTDRPTDRQTDRQTNQPTDRPTDMCNALCPSFFKGGHKYENPIS